MQKYMKMAVKCALNGVENFEGGPFGAVVVSSSGAVVGYGNNQVLKTYDPTAHAEIVAIRDAASNLKTYDLKDCKIYSTSEPCPMCLSAIIWANIKEVYYATTRTEVGSIGFRDEIIYDYLEGKKNLNMIRVMKVKDSDCDQLLEKYKHTIY